MMRKFYIISILLSLFIFGCSGNNGSINYRVIDLEDAFENNSQYVNLSKYATALDYIPLETNVESVLNMGHKPQMQSDGKNIIVYDESCKSLKFFDCKTGEFIKSFDRRGRGPGEYVGFYFWDTKGSLGSEDFRVVVQSSNKILMYDGRDSCLCEFATSKPNINMTSIMDLFFSPQSHLLYTIETARRYNTKSAWYDKLDYLVCRDSIGKETSRILIAVREPQDSFQDFPVFFKYGKDLKFTNSTRDTIYRYNQNEGLVTDFLINYGKYEYIKRMGLGTAGRENFFYIDIVGVYETDSLILIAGCLPESELPQIYTRSNYNPFCTSYILYDKKETKTYALRKLPDYNYIGFIDDINGGMPFKPRFIQDKKMYQFVDAYEFIELAKQHGVPKMKEIAATLTEESNLVMVVATLK